MTSVCDKNHDIIIVTVTNINGSKSKVVTRRKVIIPLLLGACALKKIFRNNFQLTKGPIIMNFTLIFSHQILKHAEKTVEILFYDVDTISSIIVK